MERLGAALVRIYPVRFRRLECSLTGLPGHCYLMMDDLQQAYNAYQAALLHLPTPKVGDAFSFHWLAMKNQRSFEANIGASTLVRDRHLVRPVWLVGSRRGSLCRGYEDAAGFRQGSRNLFPAGYHLQAATQVQRVTGGMLRDSIRLLQTPDLLSVLQIHRQLSAYAAHGGGHLVSNWPCSRTTEGRMYKPRAYACFRCSKTNYGPVRECEGSISPCP